MVGEGHGSVPIIKLNGTRLPSNIEPQLTRLIVVSDLVAPGSCQITLADPGRELLSKLGVDFGNPTFFQVIGWFSAGGFQLFTYPEKQFPPGLGPGLKGVLHLRKGFRHVAERVVFAKKEPCL